MNTTEKRFQAAMAAMQGILSGRTKPMTEFTPSQLASDSVKAGDALLAELDRTETKQIEPTIPAPPEGFTVWGEGPLTWPSDPFIADIAMLCTDEWELRFSGNSADDIYALRDGSETQRLNGRVKP